MEDVLSFKILEQEYAISIENIESVVDMTEDVYKRQAVYLDPLRWYEPEDLIPKDGVATLREPVIYPR